MEQTLISGDRLRELRKERGLSRRELAEKLQIGEANIQRYEDGKSDAGTEIAIKIAQFFKVSTDYLLGINDEPALNISNLNAKEAYAIAAWRRGERIEAIKMIASDE